MEEPPATRTVRGQAASWRRLAAALWSSWSAHAQRLGLGVCGRETPAPGAGALMAPLVAGREAH